MDVTPFVHKGLGNSSYLLDLGNGSAAVIDPDRSVRRYIEAANGRGLRIEAVFETHLHADFVTGALELAQATGAPVFASAGGALRYPHRALGPADRVPLNGAVIEAVASPGHTPEHLSYVLRAARRPPMLFSGGALIVGGAARTDLISAADTDRLTRELFHTLREAFASLPDETALYPTHGGGSFCSTGSAKKRTSTMGEERRTNPLLRFDDEDEFRRWFPTTFPAVPAYFSRMRAFNQKGPRPRQEIGQPRPMTPREFEEVRSSALVVDVRSIEAYGEGHVPGSLNIMFRPSYATWLGWLAPEGTPLAFVLGEVDLEAVVEESLLVGYEDFAGYLEGGLEAWRREGFEAGETEVLGAGAARDVLREGAMALDVREPSEFDSGHIENALHIPLGELPERLSEVPQGTPILTYCGVGERSSTAASILKRAGHNPVFNLAGGMEAWEGRAGSAERSAAVRH